MSPRMSAPFSPRRQQQTTRARTSTEKSVMPTIERIAEKSERHTLQYGPRWPSWQASSPASGPPGQASSLLHRSTSAVFSRTR
eukprot:scaffold1302_cov245-Pinguiococcus_pyrenoidosus.AAC.5